MAAECTGKQVLVIGGAGFLGSHVVDALAAAAARKVVVLDDLRSGRREHLQSAAKQLGERLRCVWEPALGRARLLQLIGDEQLSVVFHCCGPNGEGRADRSEGAREHIERTCHLGELLRLGVYQRLVQLSRGSVYDGLRSGRVDERDSVRPITLDAVGWGAADAIALAYAESEGLDTQVLRLFEQFGPRQSARHWLSQAIEQLLRGEPWSLSAHGERRRDLSLVSDTAHAIVQLGLTPAARGRLLLLGSEAPQREREVLEALARALGIEGGWRGGEEDEGGAASHRFADSTEASRLLGARQHTPLDEGMRALVSWYQAEGEAQRQRDAVRAVLA